MSLCESESFVVRLSDRSMGPWWDHDGTVPFPPSPPIANNIQEYFLFISVWSLWVLKTSLALAEGFPRMLANESHLLRDQEQQSARTRIQRQSRSKNVLEGTNSFDSPGFFLSNTTLTGIVHAGTAGARWTLVIIRKRHTEKETKILANIEIETSFRISRNVLKFRSTWPTAFSAIHQQELQILGVLFYFDSGQLPKGWSALRKWLSIVETNLAPRLPDRPGTCHVVLIPISGGV